MTWWGRIKVLPAGPWISKFALGIAFGSVRTWRSALQERTSLTQKRLRFHRARDMIARFESARSKPRSGASELRGSGSGRCVETATGRLPGEAIGTRLGLLA